MRMWILVIAATFACTAMGRAADGVPNAPVLAQPVPVNVPPAASDVKGAAPVGSPIWAGDRSPFLSVPGENNVEWDPMDVIGGHLSAGGGVYLIHPNFSSNPAYVVARQDGTTFRQFQQDFRYDLEPAPLAWIAYTTEDGLGFRVRWWQFDESAHLGLVNDGTMTITSALPLGQGVISRPNMALHLVGMGDVSRFDSDLKLTVWDFEGTQAIQAGSWELTLAAGLRWVWMSQDYAANLVDGLGNSDTVLASHNFDGVGPTVAAEGRYRIGEGGLALYGHARAALPFGNAHQEAFHVARSPAGINGEADSATSHYTVLPIGELELGTEYGLDIRDTHLFVQAGFVGQAWFCGGNAANVDNALTNDSNGAGNFGFVGAVFRAGLTY